MNVRRPSEPIKQRPREAPDRWGTSATRSRPGAVAWALAVVIVLAFALGLHFLYQ